MSPYCASNRAIGILAIVYSADQVYDACEPYPVQVLRQTEAGGRTPAPAFQSVGGESGPDQPINHLVNSELDRAIAYHYVENVNRTLDPPKNQEKVVFEPEYQR